MPYSVLNAACCCSPSCTTPYIVFRPCNDGLDVPDIVAPLGVAEKCGFYANEDVWLYDSPFCNAKYCGRWVCDNTINEDTEFCIPGSSCGCDATSPPRLLRPSDNCDVFTKLEYNDEFQDATCCDTRCPERVASCYEGDITGPCPEGFRLRACECTDLDQLQYELDVNWQQHKTTTTYIFDYFLPDGTFIYKEFSEQDTYVSLVGASIVEGSTLECGDMPAPYANDTIKYLTLECTWRAHFNMVLPAGADLTACTGDGSAIEWQCAADGTNTNLGTTVSWTDDVVTRNVFYYGLVNDKAVFQIGPFIGAFNDAPDDSTPENALDRGNGCVTYLGDGSRARSFADVSGLSIRSNPFLNSFIPLASQSDNIPGISICAGMQGEHVYAADVAGRTTTDMDFDCVFGGAWPESNHYGTLTVTMRLIAPPPPPQQGQC